MEKDWLDSLRERMADYEESAPEGLWKDIDAAVPGRKKAGGIVLPGRMWRMVAAAAVGAVGAFAGVKLFSPKESIGSHDIAVLQESPASPLNSSPSSVNSEGSRTSSVAVADGPAARVFRPSSRKEAEVRPAASAAGSAAGELPQPVSPEDPLFRGEEPAPSQGKPRIREEESARQVTAPDVEPESHDGEDWSRYASASNERGGKHALAPADMNLSVSGGATESESTSSYNSLMFYRGASPKQKPSGDPSPGGEDMPVSNLKRAPSLKSSTVRDDVSHRRPIRAGMTFRWRPGNTFGVETGVTWSMLSSTFTTTSGVTVSEDDQTLHYIGVPLNLTAGFLNTRFLSLYASAGGMVEKNVSGTVKTTVTQDGKPVGNVTTRTIKVEPLQWSVGAALGLQFNATDHLGFYAEPGVSYRFDNGSPVRTIYKDRPFDFTLGFGVRISFR